VGAAIICSAGTFNYGVHYFDGTADYFQVNSQVPSLTYTFMINGVVQSVLTTTTASTKVSISISTLPSTGLLTCQVMGSKGGVTASALTTSNTSGMSAAMTQQSNAIAVALATYQATVLANSAREKAALADNRNKWRNTIETAKSIFASSGHKSSDVKMEIAATRSATEVYKAGTKSALVQCADDDANALYIKNEALAQAAATYALAQEAAGYGVVLG
jgi:hypothetical protein